MVHLLNRLTFPVNLLASGLNTSAVGTDQVAGPTQTVTWTWSVPLDVRLPPLCHGAYSSRDCTFSPPLCYHLHRFAVCFMIMHTPYRGPVLTGA